LNLLQNLRSHFPTSKSSGDSKIPIQETKRIGVRAEDQTLAMMFKMLPLHQSVANLLTAMMIFKESIKILISLHRYQISTKKKSSVLL